MKAFLKKLALSLLGIIAILFVVVKIFSLEYLVKGVRVVYLNGEETAFLSDYEYFDNHIIEKGIPQPWAVAANKLELVDSLKEFHTQARSVAYLLIHRDTIVLEEYFDGYNETSKSNSFSMAKSMVSAILGKVIETGQIKSLDQKIIDFVPETAGPFAKELTFRDLVSMSSGMKWDEDYYSPFSITTQLYFDENLLDVLKKLPIEKKPGQRFIYQSGDTQLLGMAIQRATGKSLSALLSEYFWKPMGTEHEALWQVDSEKSGFEKGYCCVASNARDFARFGKLYYNKGNWNGQQLLSENYIAESLNPRFQDSPQYGLGWWMNNFEGKPYFYMDGHLGQYVIVIPEDELIIVRLGHQIDYKSRNDPNSQFYRFIKHGYDILEQNKRL